MNIYKHLTIIFILVFITSCQTVGLKNNVYGDVITVLDGDTLTLLDDSKKVYTVHLADIDAPDNNQLFSSEAKTTLFQLAFDRPVRVEIYETNYNTLKGRVFVEDIDVCAELVKAGLATVSSTTQDPQLLDLERQAQEAGRGVWARYTPELEISRSRRIR